jgi:hypothetical protein
MGGVCCHAEVLGMSSPPTLPASDEVVAIESHPTPRVLKVNTHFDPLFQGMPATPAGGMLVFECLCPSCDLSRSDTRVWWL